jgi:hypothetical protein
MSATATPSVTIPLTTPRNTYRPNLRGTVGARWALLAAFVIGAGGAGVSAGLVHNEVHTRTVFVPVPDDPAAPAGGNVQRKV